MIQATTDSAPRRTQDRPGFDRDCVACEIRKGIPTTSGWGYYASRNGMRMLVVERRRDQRIRINDKIDIVVLDADDDKVRLGIEGAPDSPRRTAK